MTQVPKSSIRLLAALLISSFLGCNTTDNTETALRRITQNYQDVINDPMGVDSNRFDSTINELSQVANMAFGTKAGVEANQLIGNLYEMRGQYAEARRAFTSLISHYGQDPAVDLYSKAAIARIYLAEDNWEVAKRIYEELAELYPWSDSGLGALLHVAIIHEERNHKEDATAAWQKAIERYAQLINTAPSPSLRHRAQWHLAEAYQLTNQATLATKELEFLVNEPEFIESSNAFFGVPDVLFRLAFLYQTIDEPQRKDAVLTRLANEYPEHELGKSAVNWLSKHNENHKQP